MERQPPSLGERISYRLDNLMAWNPIAKLLGLFAVTMAIVLAGGVLYIAFAGKDVDLVSATWSAWTFVADPGTQGGEEGTGARGVATLVTVAGLMVFAMLVGLVTDAIGEKVDELKKGKSRVIEDGHTVILGWDEKIVPLIEHTAVANESAGGGVVVVMSERPKEEMEDELRHLLPKLRGSTLVCRSGNPTLPTDLALVGADAARAVVVLGSSDDPEASDVRAIKIALALRRGLGGLSGHAVVEVMDRANLELVQLVGEGSVEPVVAHDLIGRLMIQAARQPGLAYVYQNLVGFVGNEFYLKRWPQLGGRPFGELVRSFPAAVPCGIRTARGEMLLNPPDDRVIAAEDELLVLAEDDDSYAPAPPASVDAGALPDWRAPPRAAERMLFCGWRRDIDDMILELDKYVGPGSELTLVAEVPLEERAGRLAGIGEGKLENLRLSHVQGSTTSRRFLEALQVERFDSVLILADDTLGLSGEEIDARDLVTLLLIRSLQAKHGREAVSLIAEIRDPRTKELAQVAKASDYVVSDELVSLMLAQVAERRELAAVFADLFDAEGNEIYLKDARRYAKEGEALSFLEISARARLRRELVLGHWRGGEREPSLNPGEKAARLPWRGGDKLVVLAETEA